MSVQKKESMPDFRCNSAKVWVIIMAKKEQKKRRAAIILLREGESRVRGLLMEINGGRILQLFSLFTPPPPFLRRRKAKKNLSWSGGLLANANLAKTCASSSSLFPVYGRSGERGEGRD